MSDRPRVLIDCDPGHDDALALMVAAAHADIVGITTVSGNASIEHTTRNACVLRDLLGLDKVEIHRGAARPLVAPPRYAPQIHGVTGLDGPPPREPKRGVDGDDAAAFIIETCRRHDDVWLIPTGPLTNIALALCRDPSLVDRVAGISLMGGSAGSGNVTSTAEFNVWVDPEAAAVTFGCGAKPLRMAGLNLTRRFTIDDVFLDDLRASTSTSPLVAFSSDLIAFYLDSQEAQTGRRAGLVHDVCAVLAVTHPQLINLEPRHVEVELSGTVTRGMTVVDERLYPGWESTANADVGYGIDASKARTILAAAILRKHG